MKTLYLECRMGAAGDMLLSALYELLDHAGKQKFLDAMNGLGLPGSIWSRSTGPPAASWAPTCM